MLSRLGRVFRRPWTRRTRWTPLLQTQREFQRTLSKERSRVDRDGGWFGLIILRLVNLKGAKAQTKHLARLLHRRLRDTDEKGHLGFGRIGIVLPATDSVETQLVLNSILKLAKAQNLAIEGEALVYPERGPKGFDDSDHSNAGTFEVGASIESTSGGNRTSKMLAMMVPEYPRWKRTVDVAGATVGLGLALPVVVVCGLMIKLTSPGPVLFAQRRTGYLGQPFTIYKFRSMVLDAENLKAKLLERNERDGPAFKMADDPRTTTFGRFMRATGIDELPQLFNVLKGDMALVGPRPLPIHEAAQCSKWQTRRTEAKPGLTCFWQVQKSRNISFDEWMRMDIEYVRNISPAVDFGLVLRTISAMFLGRVGH